MDEALKAHCKMKTAKCKVEEKAKTLRGADKSVCATKGKDREVKTEDK